MTLFEKLGMGAEVDENQIALSQLIDQQEVAPTWHSREPAHSPLSSWSRYSGGNGWPSQIIPMTSRMTFMSCRPSLL